MLSKLLLCGTKDWSPPGTSSPAGDPDTGSNEARGPRDFLLTWELRRDWRERRTSVDEEAVSTEPREGGHFQVPKVSLGSGRSQFLQSHRTLTQLFVIRCQPRSLLNHSAVGSGNPIQGSSNLAPHFLVAPRTLFQISTLLFMPVPELSSPVQGCNIQWK